jgi:hypothetical protein
LGWPDYPTLDSLMLQQKQTLPNHKKWAPKKEQNIKNRQKKDNDSNGMRSGLHRNRSGFHHQMMLEIPAIQRGYRGFTTKFHGERACLGKCDTTG